MGQREVLTVHAFSVLSWKLHDLTCLGRYIVAPRERFQTLKRCNSNIVSLIFTVPSYFQSRPAYQSVQEGDEASFHCGAIGNPTPKVSWFKDGRSIGTGNTLSFVAFRNRSGEYWCSADNGLGSAINASARLNVQSKYKWVAFGTNV